jgi:flagella basal body P-ring formation protein FlgA
MIWRTNIADIDTKLDLAFRIAAMLAVVALTAIALGLGANIAHAETAKPRNNEVAISGKHIRLKHVFHNTGEKGHKILGPAPEPGEDMVLEASTLYRVSRAFNLQWKPSTMSEQLVLTRDAHLVGSSTIRKALEDKIKAKDIYNHFNVTLNDSDARIILPPDSNRSVHVANLRLNTASDTFRAKLVAPSADNPVAQKRVRGTIARMSEVPVLKRSMRSGDVIKKRHLKMLAIPAEDINGKILVNTDDIAGMTPRNIVRPGKPVRENQLTRPKLVKRGEKVTIKYKKGPLNLTAKGKALESGAKGEIIRAVNLDSNKTLDTHVKGDRQVRIY